jgi:hypothetical protein
MKNGLNCVEVIDKLEACSSLTHTQLAMEVS